MTKASFARNAAAVVSIAAAFANASAAQGKKVKAHTDRERLIGTWHLVKIDSPTADGKPQPPLPTASPPGSNATSVPCENRFGSPGARATSKARSIGSSSSNACQRGSTCSFKPGWQRVQIAFAEDPEEVFG